MCAAMATLLSCANRGSNVEVISEGLLYNEGTTPYKSSILISNFGSSQLNPLNSEGMGYITQLKNGKIEMFIPASGVLNAPKGMDIEDDYLYIADVGKVVVYNLMNLTAEPQVILLPEEDIYVNDIAIEDDVAYISVTNTVNIYALDISRPARLTADDLTLYTQVVGANGIEIEDDIIYIASYPADGVTTADNVIYQITNIANPQPVKLFNRMGQYDGLAEDDDRLYFTNWVDGEVGFVDLDTNVVTLLDLGEIEFSGPADITIEDNVLYIPDLPNSRIVQIYLK